ncbi:MAG TPA: hypothetical protein VJ023_01440 [Pyrinomonadaceae bacterium]|nr:hypothetical protein [Pyrinomonadaceae bacterium]
MDCQKRFGDTRTIRILSHLPVLVQAKTAPVRKGRKKTQRVYLPTITIIIRYSESGDVIIETEPP